MAFQPSHRLIDRVAAGVPPGQVDVGGDGFPVQPGEDAGFGPGSGVVIEDVAFAVPGHLADREHGFDVCWHASNSLHVWVDQISVMSVLPGGVPRQARRPGSCGLPVSGSRVTLAGRCVLPVDEQRGDDRQQVPAA